MSPARRPAQVLADTEAWWCEWAAHCTYRGPWRDIVVDGAAMIPPVGAQVSAFSVTNERSTS